MPMSGEECKEAGDYKAECSKHNVQRSYKVGEPFTNCPRSMRGGASKNDHHKVNWIKV